MKNQLLADIFNRMVEMYELKGDKKDMYRIRAYQRAALVMRELPNDIEEIANDGKLREIPGIGEHLAEKIEQFLKNGKIKQHEELKKAFPDQLLKLLSIQTLGPKKLKILHDEFGVIDILSLEKILHEGKVQNHPGFGEKTVQNILQGISLFKTTQERSLLGEIYLNVNRFVEYMKKCKEVKNIEPAGSFRRKCETIGDIDILAAGKNHQKIIDHFTKHPEVEKVTAKGETKASIILRGGKQIDIRAVDPKEWGSALQYFTGSKAHNIHLRTISKDKGIKISEYGAFKGEKRIAGNTEESMYQCVGMQYMPPEMREDRGEIELAIKHEIPALVELKDIKGDLHVHSKYSDGGNSIEEIAAKAMGMGYEYIAISDHSEGLKVARGLVPQTLLEKKKEIYALNEKMKIKILCGAEVDIREDGSLDYPDEILKKLDFVIAAIHTRFNQDNTERIIRAMENPYVHAIAHISGRMLGSREGYPLDYDRIFAKAVETKTLIEINSQPIRLDITDIHAHKAKEMGVKFIISTDSHSVHSLWYMDLGISVARRAWLTKEDVANTETWARLKTMMKGGK